MDKKLVYISTPYANLYPNTKEVVDGLSTHFDFVNRIYNNCCLIDNTVFGTPYNADVEIFSLGKNLEEMAKADIIVFPPKCFEKSKSCQLEYDCAVTFGFKNTLTTETGYVILEKDKKHNEMKSPKECKFLDKYSRCSAQKSTPVCNHVKNPLMCSANKN